MKKQRNRGITLIALVITIIVLLILAGVSIAMLTGENGILTQAQKAKTETENAQANEESILDNYAQYIEGSTNGGTLTTVTGNETENTKVQDSLGNTVWVPAGFKVVNPGDNVEDGIIIEDVSAKDEITKGSQFVWIPTGTIQTSEGTKTINLNRYDFSSNIAGEAKGTESIKEYYGADCQELATSSYGNTTAINIDGQNGFLEKVDATGGFYIGRYEARDGIATSARIGSTEDRQVVTKAESFVYNYISQTKAAELSRNMYSNSNFTTDLINSYAWDTALVFIQECEDEDYSQQHSLNTGNVASTGTNDDVKCNIFDMASNCFEWTTETAISSYSGIFRGGIYYYSDGVASTRSGHSTTDSNVDNSFRPILYL